MNSDLLRIFSIIYVGYLRPGFVFFLNEFAASPDPMDPMTDPGRTLHELDDALFTFFYFDAVFNEISA